MHLCVDYCQNRNNDKNSANNIKIKLRICFIKRLLLNKRVEKLPHGK